MAERFFIIDGLSQIFRSYYAPFQNLTSPAGEPTRATYVFTNMLLQLIRKQKPDFLAVAMEGGDQEVFRAEIDPQYKATREPPPEDLAPQIQRILQVLETMHVPILSVPGFEADDILATLAARLPAEDIDVVLVSRDKDLDQVLSERVRLFDPMKDEFIGPDELRAAKGYGPDKAIEIQTLTGDSTDNVPGVKGIGPKKAAALIEKYGTAQAVLDHADELTPAMSANVKAFADRIDIARQLVTLRRDVPLELDPESCRWSEVDYAALEPLFAELGFRRLLEQARAASGSDTVKPSSGGAPSSTAATGTGEAPPSRRPRAPASDAGGLFAGIAAAEAASTAETGATADTSQRHYVLVDDEDAFRAFLAELKQQKRFAFDTETTHINPAHADLVGMSFAWAANTGYYLPIRGAGRCLPKEPTLAALRPIFADPDVEKVGQNLKYDLVVLMKEDVQVAGIAFDSMIASFVLDSSRRSHGMDALCRELLGFEPIPISDLIGKGKDQIRFDAVDTRTACEYAAEDADVTWQLCEILRKQLHGTKLEELFRETELPLVEVLAAMEAEGVRLDVGVLEEMSRTIEVRVAELTDEIYEKAKRPFNIDSTKQLAEVLFDELNLPVQRKTKTGRSTDAETLETLAPLHEVPRLILEYRELVKLKGTYIDALPRMVCPRTGRIHAGFHQTVAVTGRLSSSDPNLQNIPIRTELGRQIRRAFVPSDADHLLVTADYSQIELRVLAHFCQDKALKRAFEDDLDIHQFVAAQVFAVPIEEVTREQRGPAKAVNFGIIYGQSAFGLARTTGMSQGEAQSFIDMYFMRYPGIRLFIDRVIEEARHRGYVETILGRRRHVPDITSRNRTIRSAAERFAVNTVIQGSAADMIKRAMIHIHRRIRDEKRPSRLLIQVHDELVLDVPREGVEAEAEFIRHEMTTALPFDVPIKVDLAWGENWLEGK